MYIFIGKQILEALENGVCKYPKTEGRFPQISGISFGFDPEAEPGKRIDPNLVRIGDEYLVPDQLYKLATKCYLHNGCDGYTMLKNSPIIVCLCFMQSLLERNVLFIITCSTNLPLFVFR